MELHISMRNKNCEMERNYWSTRSKSFGNCFGQAIDLNSDNFNEVVSQKNQLSAGKYLLHFNYFYPVMASKMKKLQVQFNN